MKIKLWLDGDYARIFKNESKIRNKISELFIKHLHRNTDLEGLDYYEKKISEGRSFQWVEESLANSEEGKNYWN